MNGGGHSATRREGGVGDRRAAFEKNVLTRELGEPSDIAAGATYLASEEAKYVTGTQLNIDGGAVCHRALPELDFEAFQEAAER
jgi:NAD(P)-dependent dehydrogenase (short-subunit alcohol dehydrogenase family)